MQEAHRLHQLIFVIFLAFFLSNFITWGASQTTTAPAASNPLKGFMPYDMGNPESLVELYISPSGNDNNKGNTPEKPFRTLYAAWEHITGTAKAGYRINLLPGVYPFDETYNNYYSDLIGNYRHPLIIRAFKGLGTVTIEGGFNFSHCEYLYLIDIKLAAGAGVPTWGNNVLHFESCKNILLRGLTITGPDPIRYPDNYEIQETLKINQSQYIYLEDCELSGAFQTVADYFSVQYGHVFNCRIHGSGEWGMYLKGGSAYFLIQKNEFFGSRLGFQAGEGSNLEVMREPWLHYECYDIKFVNNIMHDMMGVGISAAGAYNFLAAYNTLFKVGISADENMNYPFLQLVHGQRGCVDTSENGVGNAERICGDYLKKGAWGTDVITEESIDLIPNKNIFIYNNIFYNPAPYRTYNTHFWVQEALIPPKNTKNVPSPSRCDDNLQIRGNLVWNGPRDLPLGLENASDLTESKVRANNTINVFEPQLINPAQGDFRPALRGNIFKVKTYTIPDFSWADAPQSPPVPKGVLESVVPLDAAGNLRKDPSPPGAFDN